MIIKTANSKILADLCLINVEQAGEVWQVYGLTPSKHNILLSEFDSEEKAKQFINDVYTLIPGALSLDPNDAEQAAANIEETREQKNE